ncbi:hypothetical protein DPMN_137379 [Dreissena polymorpha]|uniref:Uncharacterized protein n=1 Tax=Dreissena polymorpha TaxID=45954 RepID=A0A9D4JDK8_DREPO|nr:hypothetical protein DPMN_137379 [Dreissena polymorpha]
MSDLNDSDPDVTIRAGFLRGTRFSHTPGAQKDAHIERAGERDANGSRCRRE